MIVESIIVFIFSLTIGSFLNVVGLRMFTDEKTVNDRSRCTTCSTPLKPLDLVPVFSWVFLRGKCRHCKAKVSYIYPLGELLTAIGFTIAYVVYGFSIEFLIQVVLIAGLVVATVTDLKDMMVFDRVHVVTFIIMFILRLFQGFEVVKIYLISAIGMFLLMYLVFILSGGKMGGADVKIYAPIGLGIGFISSLESLFLASFVALVFMILLSVFTKKKIRQVKFPFIPFIAIGVILTHCFSLYSLIM